jgi:hypothetical protein
MFNFISKTWKLTKVISAFRGVVREISKGNKIEAQRWYFSLKKHAYLYAQEYGGTPLQAEQEAILLVPEVEQILYLNIISSLTSSGGCFEKIDKWLTIHKPTDLVYEYEFI